MTITQCKVHHIESPLGYQIGTPVFSWVTENALGKHQAAARLRIWQDEQKTESLYDSGWAQLDSLATPAVLDLSPRTRYFWTVSVKSNAGEEAESDINWFETGKMDEPWQG